MGEASALSALGVTILLVLGRPRVGRLVVGPALAALVGVFVMIVAGHVSLIDVTEAASVLWRPLIAIASIMVIASAASHLGVLDRLAASVLRLSGNSAERLFLLVFCLGVLTAAILNNDTAILVLTPLVVGLVRRVYPDQPRVVVPYAFAIFMAAGVAPIVTSNPINLIVANFAGLDFIAYAVRMIPVAVASSFITFVVLRWLFRGQLASAGAGQTAAASEATLPAKWAPAERHGLILVFCVLGAYPFIELVGGPVWFVAFAGAIAATLICAHYDVITPARLFAGGVSWQILAFLLGVFTLAIGLRNAGAVDWLIAVYTPPNIATIGIVSAAGSALINNHSMALTNIVAIDGLPGNDHLPEFLAALIGGDLGPRLLPIGSLAGLLWYATLERMDVHIPLIRFMFIGAIVTAPSLAAGLGVLALMGG